MSWDKELNLEKDFSPPTYEEWRAAAEKSLKGTPLEKLVTRTYEGIDLHPIYTKKDTDGLPGLNQKPGFTNYMRGTKPDGYKNNPWEICQGIRTGLASQFNEILKHNLLRGQTSINLTVGTVSKYGLDSDKGKINEIGEGGIAISTYEDFVSALAGIKLEKYPLHMDAGLSGVEAAMMLTAFLKEKKLDMKQIKGSIASDILGFLATHGSLPVPLSTLYDGMARLVTWASQKTNNFKTVLVSGIPYHNAGADAVRELAYVLATAVEYIAQLQERGLDISTIAAQMRFTFAVGPFYFMELAKIRAARVLWARIIEAWGGNEDARKITIHARTSTYYHTRYDPYTNMLRSTTEAFSAVAAGVDSLETGTFDETSANGDEFSRRVARNTQILLREESQLDELIDPAGGSYYVEKLTHQVCQKAWELFQDIERKGGMLKALEKEFPQKESLAQHEMRIKDIGKRKALIVGTNYSANVKEKKTGVPTINHQELFEIRKQYLDQFRSKRTPEQLKEIETKLSSLNKLSGSANSKMIDAGAEALKAGATLGEITSITYYQNLINSFERKSEQVEPIETIIKKSRTQQNVCEIEIKPLEIHRAAEKFEELRDRVAQFKEKSGSAPKVFIAAMGPLPQYKARADFSQAFFEVGGFEVVYPELPQGKGFETPEAAVDGIMQAKIPVAVICSTDDTYPQLVPPIAQALKKKKPDIRIMLAGYPKDQVEMYKQAGIDGFIYLGADAHQILSRLLEDLGI